MADIIVSIFFIIALHIHCVCSFSLLLKKVIVQRCKNLWNYLWHKFVNIVPDHQVSRYYFPEFNKEHIYIWLKNPLLIHCLEKKIRPELWEMKIHEGEVTCCSKIKCKFKSQLLISLSHHQRQNHKALL